MFLYLGDMLGVLHRKADLMLRFEARPLSGEIDCGPWQSAYRLSFKRDVALTR
jgi:hypothetical protein